MRKFPSKHLEFLALLFWGAMIFFFSNVPQLSSGLPEDFLLRKIAHMFEFAVLTYLIWRIWRRKDAGYGAVMFSGLWSLFYAITDEVHQTYIMGRSGNFFDIGIDSLGILVALVILGYGTLRRSSAK